MAPQKGKYLNNKVTGTAKTIRHKCMPIRIPKLFPQRSSSEYIVNVLSVLQRDASNAVVNKTVFFSSSYLKRLPSMLNHMIFKTADPKLEGEMQSHLLGHTEDGFFAFFH